MGFEILAAHGNQGRRWTEMVHRLPAALRDLHFLPEYGTIYRETYGHEPLLACFEDAAGFVIQAFVMRQLDSLPFLAEHGITDAYYDIANPYGYGGPLCSAAAGETSRLLRRFDAGLSEWCQSHCIASEFCSLHPLLRNHEAVMAALPQLAVREEKRIVYIDLAPSEAELFRAANRGHRGSIQKARRAGFRIERVEAASDNLAIFLRLYRQTLDRHAAAQRWYFPDEYVGNCVTALGAQRASLFFAAIEERVASAYLLLHDFGTAYYHFGGSDHEFFDLRPNNLLLHETTLWAKRAGYLCYHLGGGVTAREDDSLLRFKSGFGGQRATLYTYGRVHHEATYRRLCDLKREHEAQRPDAPRDAAYFPLYRR